MGFFRTILFAINQMTFQFIGTVYSFLLTIAEQGNLIYENTDLGAATSKIYVLVGVIMLFRLGISLLRYIANPDAVMDKKDGFGKNIIPHVVVVLVMIVFTPTLFKWLYDFQTIIINDGILTTFFLSDNENTGGVCEEEAPECICDGGAACAVAEDGTNTCSHSTGTYRCPSGYSYSERREGGQTTRRCSKDGVVDPAVRPTSIVYGTCPSGQRPNYIGAGGNNRDDDAWSCDPIITSPFANNGTSFADAVMLSFVVPNPSVPETSYPEGYKDAKEEVEKNCPVSYTKLGDDLNKKDGGEYILEYNGFISLITGVIVLGMLIASLFQVGLRLFKLIALEIIAPIPIISYIDPTKKSGTTPFDKWIKSLVSTYVDLFIRLLIISFVVLIIGNLGNYITSDGADSLMLRIFILIGALLFMNAAPAFIGEILGIKLEAGSFNPFKQMSSVPGMNKVAGGSLGAVSGGIKGFAQGGMAGAAAGTALGAMYGSRNAVKGKSFTQGWDGGRDGVAKALADGPSTSGGVLERKLQRNASTALRSDVNSAYSDAKALQGPGSSLKAAENAYKASETAVDTARNDINASKETVNNLRNQSSFYQSQMVAFQQQGDTTNANLMANNILTTNTMIAAEEARLPGLQTTLGAAEATFTTAKAAYKAEAAVFNAAIDNYNTEIKNMNITTGKDSTQYGPDPGEKFDKIKID